MPPWAHVNSQYMYRTPQVCFWMYPFAPECFVEDLRQLIIAYIYDTTIPTKNISLISKKLYVTSYITPVEFRYLLIIRGSCAVCSYNIKSSATARLDPFCAQSEIILFFLFSKSLVLTTFDNILWWAMYSITMIATLNFLLSNSLNLINIYHFNSLDSKVYFPNCNSNSTNTEKNTFTLLLVNVLHTNSYLNIRL